MNPALDEVAISFSPAAVLALQFILAVVIFGVSLELSFSDFRRLLRQPRPIIAGLLSQIVALPLLTFLLVLVADPLPSLALGLMMTAACPGGNMSNVLTHWSGGRTAVSMSLTTISSLVSPITTPLTFTLLGGLHPATQAAMKQISVPFSELVTTVVIALLIPLIAGMSLAQARPALAARLQGPLKKFGVGVFFLFVLMACAANYKLFAQTIGAIFLLVLAHNALALLSGYSFGTLFRLHEAERRAVTFESGIHNLALGMTLIFTYFQGMGGMALVAGWWGVWHLVTGGLLARYWVSRKPTESAAA
jgi:BASS family bile acid:Na+ symporter